MSHRDEDMTFPELIRQMHQRLKFLENGAAGVKRNNIRIGEMIVSTDPVTNQMCIENLESGEMYCFGEGDEDAIFSFSGDLPAVPGVDTYISPPHIMAQNQVAKEIVLALKTVADDDVVCTLSFSTFLPSGSTGTGTTTVSATLPTGKNIWVTPVFILCPHNSMITVELSDFGGTAENLSVFVRFGSPSGAIQTESTT